MVSLLELKEPTKATAQDTRAYEHSQGDVRFLAENWKKLLARHPEEWIAIHGKRVVAHNPDLQLVLQAIDSRGLRRRDVVLEFLTREQRIFIL